MKHILPPSVISDRCTTLIAGLILQYSAWENAGVVGHELTPDVTTSAFSPKSAILYPLSLIVLVTQKQVYGVTP